MSFRALKLNSKLTDHVFDDPRLNRGILPPVFAGRQSAKDKPVVIHPKMMLFPFDCKTWGTRGEHRKDVLQVRLAEGGQESPG
jgi:hypothetical protein